MDPGDTEIVILGMGRVRTGTYDVMHKKYGKKVLGIENDNEVLSEHLAANRKVLWVTLQILIFGAVYILPIILVWWF